jgi:uncharacterized Ntn-hydrolase superfamily protein
MDGKKPVATFSIVAGDVQSGEIGVAVASKFLAVGAVVPWASAAAGAVATQSYANASFGAERAEADARRAFGRGGVEAAAG